MQTALRRELFFSLLLALTLPLASCDSGGAGDSEPIWIGDWEVVSVDAGQFEEGNYWTLSREEVVITDFATEGEDPGESGCETRSASVSNIGGNTVEFSNEEGTNTVKFEGSGDEITATVTESSFEGEEGSKATLQSVDNIPDCN